MLKIDELLRKIKSRVFEGQEEPGQEDDDPVAQPTKEEPDIFADLGIFIQLESKMNAPREGYPRNFLEKDQGVSDWPLPLPYDVVFTIIHTYLLDDSATLGSLSNTCRSLAHFCRPLRFRTIHIRSRNNRPAERFATLIADSPEILDLVHSIRILDAGYMFTGSRPITVEEQCLCFILTRSFPNITQLQLTIHFVWDILLEPLKEAFCTALSSPTLKEVVFEHIRIPVHILRHLDQITELEFRGETNLPPTTFLGVEHKTLCSPQSLLVQDTSHSGFIINHLFHEVSPLRLNKLRTLKVYIQLDHIEILSSHFTSCTALTTLEVYLGNRWGYQIMPLNLSALPCLTSLTLTADISMMPWGSPGSEAPQRFTWLAATVGTLARPSNTLQNLLFIIRTRAHTHAQYLPWSHLEPHFSPVEKFKRDWPHLQKFRIRFSTSVEGNMKRYPSGKFRAVLIEKAPWLALVDCLRTEWTSDRYGGFWNP